jgi:hypothetical protein
MDSFLLYIFILGLRLFAKIVKLKDKILNFPWTKDDNQNVRWNYDKGK